jgi:hypothetical protein
MEPVFMILGQSSATAAVLALRSNSSLQDVAYSDLRAQLLKDGQVLDLPPQSAPRILISKESLPGLVLDNAEAVLEGHWVASSSSPNYVGAGYLHDGDLEKGTMSATWTLTAPKSATFQLNLSYSPGNNRSTRVPVRLQAANQQQTVLINQQQKPKIDGLFLTLHTLPLQQGEKLVVTISNQDTQGHVIVDAVQLVEVAKDNN